MKDFELHLVTIQFLIKIRQWNDIMSERSSEVRVLCLIGTALCHAILFHRCFAVIRPMDAEIESLSLSHAKVPDPDIDKLIDIKCKELTNDLSQQKKLLVRSSISFILSSMFPFIIHKKPLKTLGFQTNGQNDCGK
jgi:hypothetical protein